MPELCTSITNVNGFSLRIWRKGSGPKLGFIPGFGGLPRWIPFLDVLARSRTVIVPSLPGFPGGGKSHSILDNHLDWVLAVRQLLIKAELLGSDLVGSSVGGALAAEMAAIWPDSTRRLVLISPFGLFEEADPPTDIWAQRAEDVASLVCADPEKYRHLKSELDGADPVEWAIEQVRANEAAARFLWPLGETQLKKRLPLISSPTLLIWGEQDRVMPQTYAKRFADGIRGKTELRLISGAGHLAELDRPEAVAQEILTWTS